MTNDEMIARGTGRGLTWLRATVATVALAGAFALPAYAQEAPAAGGAQAEEASDVIVVTGSRIARPDVDANVPIAVLGSEQLQQDAAVNVQDILNELPQVGIGTSRTNTNFLTSGNGVATINLRNLGTQRTLVLVNGRRFVAGLGGTSTVDINNIPTDFIERVEVVTGGASAVYGSEAIAGVVNFILKDEFEGIQARAQYGITDEGDNPRYMVSLTGGTTFGADDRGSAVFNFSYDKDEGLLSRKRSISSQDCGPAGCGPQSYSSYAAQGRFQLFDSNGDAANALNGQSRFTFNPDNSVVAGFPIGYGFNRNSVRRISTPVERYLATGIFKYEIADGHEAFAEVTYSKVKSSSQIEAYALDSDTDVGARYTLDNPFIPTEVLASINAYNAANPGAPVTEIGFRRRQNEVFDRSNVNDRDTWRIATGLRGDITDRWSYEVSYVFGQLKDYTASEDLNILNYAQALDAIRLPDGNIVCRSEAARAAGCVPINLFGYNTASPEASAYVQAVVPRANSIKNTQHVFAANVSGSLLELPAGDLGVAFGGEYRKEKSVDDWDVLTNTGGNAGNITPDTVGKYDVWEAFAEVNVPILADRPFFDYLGLTGAVRYSDYSTVGGVFSWNAGAEWAPVNGVRFRGVYAEANRAPNIGELFSPPSETFPSVTDPCNRTTATSGGEFAAACRAIPGVAAAIARNGIFEYTLADIQGINGFNGGNTDLKEETAKTLTLGAVFTPEQVRGLSLSVDYFDIKVEDAIDIVARATSIRECLNTGLPQFCSNVIRDPNTGFIRTVNAQNINVATLETSGIDFNLRFNRSLGLFEDDGLSLNLLYTYLIKLDRQSDPSAPVNSGRSVHLYGQGFKHKASARAAYSVGGFTGSWQINYLSKSVDTPEDEFDAEGLDPIIAGHNTIGDRWYHDVQLRYDIGEDKQYSLYAGVDNLFDSKPPILEDTLFFSTITGTTTAADVYDPFGRRFYVGASVRF